MSLRAAALVFWRRGNLFEDESIVKWKIASAKNASQ